MSKLGTLVKARRIEKGFSVRTLAYEVGCSPTYISMIESAGDDSKLSEELVVKLSAVLGLDEDVMFCAAGRVPEVIYKWSVSKPEILRALRRHAACGSSPDSL